MHLLHQLVSYENYVNWVHALLFSWNIGTGGYRYFHTGHRGSLGRNEYFKRVLPPRVTAAERVNIASPTPAGLIIWCSNCGASGELQVYNGSAWTNMIGVAASGLPVLAVTTDASGITSTSAISGGNVTSDGKSPVIQRGICWSSTPNPTIANSKSTATGTTGSFTRTLSGLSPITTYYVRSYAANPVETN